MPAAPVRLVSATVHDEQAFWEDSYLGRSLQRIREPFLPELAIHYGNRGAGRRGLSEIYNGEIARADADDLLLFVHDDAYLHDWFVCERAREAARAFDVAGVAGALNPDLRQPSWGLVFLPDLRPFGWQPHLQSSGAVNHFDLDHPKPAVFGPTPAECALLDGVLLVVRAGTLRERGVTFDEQFLFHLYDLDFCRTARSHGLRLGTWPISITHSSGGGFDSDEFRAAARAYLNKWEPAA